MRLLLIIYEYPPVGGGAGKSARGLARALTRMGHEATILTSRFEGLPAEEVVAGVRVLRIPVLRRHLNYAAPWEVFSFAVAGMMRIGWLKWKVRPQVVLSYFTIPGGPIAWLYRWRNGVPFVSLLRGQDVPGYPDTPRWLGWLMAPAARFIWRRSLFVTANSESLAELARRTMPGLEIPVVANAVDVERYQPAPGERGGPPLRILYLGRLREFKGIQDLIAGFARLRESFSGPSELTIAGFGPHRVNLELLTSRLGLKDCVRFTGRLEEPEAVAHLQRAGIVVNPSYGEGMPNAVLEAMACGAALILSDIPAHRELAREGEEALFCAPRDAASLAAALQRLAEDPDLRRRLGERARERMVRDYSYEKRAEQLLALIAARTGGEPLPDERGG